VGCQTATHCELAQGNAVCQVFEAKVKDVMIFLQKHDKRLSTFYEKNRKVGALEKSGNSRKLLVTGVFI
jgi:hypothetical protein